MQDNAYSIRGMHSLLVPAHMDANASGVILKLQEAHDLTLTPSRTRRENAVRRTHSTKSDGRVEGPTHRMKVSWLDYY